MLSQLLSTTENIAFNHLKITVQLKQPLSMASFKGKTFHGALGWALSHQHPDVYNALCDLSNLIGKECPNPYFFIPPITKKQHFDKSSFLTFELKLFGQANKFLPNVLESLFLLQDMGLGRERAQFTLSSIEIAYQSTWLKVYHRDNQHLAMPEQQSLATFLSHPLQDYTGPLNYFVKTRTPLELIQQKQKLRTTPNLSTLLFFIANRFAGLYLATSGDTINAHSWSKNTDAEPQLCHVSQRNLVGRSSSNHQQMNIQGIEGEWWYQQSAALIPWLKLGEVLHVGKKAGYGLGNYQLKLAVAAP